MEKSNSRNNIFDPLAVSGFILIAIFSVLYFLFHRYFAQIHVSLPFLNFPIFVGEMLLFVCAVLFAMQLRKNKQALNRYDLVLFLYLGWIVFRAIQGYVTLGPLAFRTAALFYYPLFFVFGARFFNRKYFTQQVIISLLLFAMGLLIVRDSFLKYSYYNLSFCILFFVLLWKTENKVFRYLFLFSLCCFLPVQDLHWGTRSHLIAFASSMIFLWGVAFFFIFRGRMLYKVGLTVIVLIVFFIMSHQYVNRAKFLSLMKFKEMKDYFLETDKEISLRSKYYHMEDLKVSLYSVENESVVKDDPVRTTSSFSRDVLLGSFNDEFQSDEMNVQSFVEKTINEYALFDEKNSGKVPLTAEQKNAIFNDVHGIAQQRLEKISSLVKQMSNDEKNSIEDISGFARKEVDRLLNDLAGIIKKKITDLYASLASIPVANNLEATPQHVVSQIEEKIKDKKTVVPVKGSSNLEPKRVVSHVQAKISNENVENAVTESKHQETINNSAKFDSNLKAAIEEYSDKVNYLGLRTVEGEYNNTMFRLLIWRDMFREMRQERAFFGVNWGKPQRSRSIEVLGQALGEWSRDGWITPHNSFLHMIYRSGVIGVIFVLCVFFAFFKLVAQVIRQKDLIGILSCTAIIYWLVLSNFLVILELPYNAIPFWSFFGIVWAYAFALDQRPVAHE